MRKLVLATAASFGLLAVSMAVHGHAARLRQADAEGSGADVVVTRHTTVAQDMVGMIDFDRTPPTELV